MPYRAYFKQMISFHFGRILQFRNPSSLGSSQKILNCLYRIYPFQKKFLILNQNCFQYSNPSIIRYFLRRRKQVVAAWFVYFWFVVGTKISEKTVHFSVLPQFTHSRRRLSIKDYQTIHLFRNKKKFKGTSAKCAMENCKKRGHNSIKPPVRSPVSSDHFCQRRGGTNLARAVLNDKRNQFIIRITRCSVKSKKQCRKHKRTMIFQSDDKRYTRRNKSKRRIFSPFFTSLQTTIHLTRNLQKEQLELICPFLAFQVFFIRAGGAAFGQV